MCECWGGGGGRGLIQVIDQVTRIRGAKWDEYDTSPNVSFNIRPFERPGRLERRENGGGGGGGGG